jgi:hypothetical protein
LTVPVTVQGAGQREGSGGEYRPQEVQPSTGTETQSRDSYAERAWELEARI